ncbi:MAG: HEAT repeat domain-containing protein [Candidatus Hydrogenedentes bacterium]|nr:HEAT repeat domain-containing protein [Candidatus Hydrogenedentota bacterium]
MRGLAAGALTILATIFAVDSSAQDPPDSAELDRAFADLAEYDTGGDQDTIDFVRAYVDRATARYKIRVDAEARLLGVLQTRQSSAAAKRFAADQLYRLCDEDTVPAFHDLLLRKDTTDIARKGLERIDHPKAEQALLDALDRAAGAMLLGIIESLGNKGDPAGAQVLSRTARGGNAEICLAALSALAKIPGPEAMDALEWCRFNLTPRMRPHATDAYIKSGWLSLEEGDYQTAIYLFDSLLIDIEAIEIRAQGLRGLIRAERDQAVPTIIEALSGNEPALRAVAAEEAGKVPGRAATEAFIRHYPDLGPENQIIVLRAFAQRGDDAALPTIVLATRSRLPEIRLAAIESAGAFNHPDVLQPILKAAASGTEEEQGIAREALARLDAPRMNDALVKAGMSADNGIRYEAVKAMAARKTRNAIPVLLRIAERDVKEIRIEALKALGIVGTHHELPFMVEMFLDAWTGENRQSIAHAIVAIARKSPAGKIRTADVSSALKKSSLPDSVHLMLVQILGDIQDDSALPALEAHARTRSPESSTAALEILANWPNDQPIDTLQRIASAAKDDRQRAIAFDGFVHMIQRPESGRGVDRTLKYYQQAAKIAATPDEKRAVIKGLSQIKHSGSLKILETFLSDSQVADDAARAKEALSQSL